MASSHSPASPPPSDPPQLIHTNDSQHIPPETAPPRIEVSDSVAVPLIPTPPPDKSEARCWICQEEWTDEPANAHREWRTPCPCSATAHNDCLLEWIKSRREPFAEVKCPICASVITVDRPPLGIIAEFFSSVELAYKISILPVTIGSLAWCLYGGSLLYGTHAMITVFGREEALRILAPPASRTLGRAGNSVLLHSLQKVQTHWKIVVGLPLIAPTLILSRTSLADPMIDIIPAVYLIFNKTSRVTLNTWPPNPATTLALLPYFRLIYNQFYQATFAPHERRWEAAVRRPIVTDQAEEPQQNPENQNPENHDPDQAAAHNGNDGDDRAEDDGLAFGLELEIEQDPHPDHPAGAPIRRNYPTAGILGSAVGALLFPSVAASIGGLLGVVLPTKWVSKGRVTGGFWGKSTSSAQGGLLAERWGRVVVGGMLFVVVRDAVVLYGKYRKAKASAEVKIRDWRGPRRGETVGGV